MRWRIGLGEDRGFDGSQVESVRAVASSFSWQAGQTITWTTDEANLFTRIGYKNIPVSIGDAPKAVQGERNVVTIISARAARNASDALENRFRRRHKLAAEAQD